MTIENKQFEQRKYQYQDVLEYWQAGSLDVSIWEKLTLEIKISGSEAYPVLILYFLKSGEKCLADTPALMLPIEAKDEFQFLEINLRALPRRTQEMWNSGRVVQMKLTARPAGSRFAIKMFLLHESALGIINSKATFIRENLAARYLQGEGIEIGALQNPLNVPQNVKVKYVDVLTKADALKHFPELSDALLVDPEIISNGQTLTGVADSSFDFCIANHVLEHMRNPVMALRNWLRVLKPGGTAYIAIPDRTNKIDHTRPVTTLEHILLDDSGLDRRENDHNHYLEWAIHSNGCNSGADAEARAVELEAQQYNIHFHVFDQTSFKELLNDACNKAPAQICELMIHKDQGAVEHICILRKGSPYSFLKTNMAEVVRPCEREKVDKLRAEEVLSGEIYAAAGGNTVSLLARLNAIHELQLIATEGSVTMISSGRDPYCIVPIEEANMPILTIEIESSAETMLQIFYATVAQQHFAEERSIRQPLSKGTNLIFALIDANKVTALRLDPGESAGVYVLRSFGMKTSDYAQGLIAEQAVLKERYTALVAPEISLLTNLRPHYQLEMNVKDSVTVLTSTGCDPHCIVPIEEVDMPILMIDIASPIKTMLQIFYKHADDAEFSEAQSLQRRLLMGRNLLYVAIESNGVTKLRLDPGESAGVYVLHAFSMRASATAQG